MSNRNDRRHKKFKEERLRHRCRSGKRGYRSKEDALHTASIRQRHGAGTLRAYLCLECRKWHLSSFIPGDDHMECGTRCKECGACAEFCPFGKPAKCRPDCEVQEDQADGQ